MKTITMAAVALLLAVASSSTAQSGTGISLGFSPRNNGSIVGTVFVQHDIVKPAETTLLFGAGAMAAFELKQANHYVPYAYAAVELSDIILGVRIGGSYTIHHHPELVHNQGARKWYAYTALHFDVLNDRRVGAFATINYSHKNWLDVSMGARFKF